MKYALVNGVRKEATKGEWGLCTQCGRVLISKCGEKKINHWAHKNIIECDPWWENESDWHRNWKDNFPEDWQEYNCVDETTGEKHRADIRTTHGLVIEFQSSFLNPEESRKREDFYKRMVWVVDGTKKKRDFDRFKNRIGQFKLTNKRGMYLVDNPENCFPDRWLDSKVTVIFDFKGIEEGLHARDIRNNLYALMPGTSPDGRALLICISRAKFIASVKAGTLFTPPEEVSKEKLDKIKKNVNSSQYYYDLRTKRFIKKTRL